MVLADRTVLIAAVSPFAFAMALVGRANRSCHRRKKGAKTYLASYGRRRGQSTEEEVVAFSLGGCKRVEWPPTQAFTSSDLASIVSQPCLLGGGGVEQF